MTDLSRLVFVNESGDIEESSFENRLRYLGFKTQNYEMTDQLLGKVVDAIDVYDGTSVPEVLYKNTQFDGEVALDSSAKQVADNFYLKNSKDLQQIVLKLKRAGSTGGATLKAEIYSDSDGPATLLHTSSNTVDVDTLTNASGGEDKTFSFSAPTLSPGKYWMVLAYSATGTTIDASNRADVFYDSAIGIHLQNTGSGWGDVYGQLTMEVDGANVTKGGDQFVRTRADGRLDDTFLQYNINMGNNKISGLADGVADDEAINYGQLRRYKEGLTYKKPVHLASNSEEVTLTNDPIAGSVTLDGVAVVAGNRYLLKDQTSDLTQNGIYEIVSDGSGGHQWQRTADFDEDSEVVTAVLVSVYGGSDNNSGGNKFTRWMLTSEGTLTVGTDPLNWDKWYISDLQDGNGITMNGDVINVDLADTEPGLLFDGNSDLGVAWFLPGTDTPGTAAKAIRAYDLFAQAANKGANLVGIQDAGSHTDETTVEGALQELYTLLEQNGEWYTAAETLGVGDLVYVSSDNTVSKFADISQARLAVGICVTAAASAGDPVRVAANDTKIPGVLSTASAGAKYFWNGTGWQTSMPSNSGEYVWQGGVARNATDLHCEVKFVKKNA